MHNECSNTVLPRQKRKDNKGKEEAETKDLGLCICD